jgi:ribosomal protein S6--L-glutamate ligase
LHVREGADIVGGTISGLRESDITVLTLIRGSKVIPNPRGDRVLAPEDRLLCVGMLEAMRDLVPERRRRRQRPKIKALPADPIPHPEPAPATEPDPA